MRQTKDNTDYRTLFIIGIIIILSGIPLIIALGFKGIVPMIIGTLLITIGALNQSKWT